MHKEVQKSYEAVYFCFFKTQCFDWLKNHWKILKLREREREKSKFILEFKKNIKVMVRFKKINTLFHIEMILLHETKKRETNKMKRKKKDEKSKHVLPFIWYVFVFVFSC